MLSNQLRSLSVPWISVLALSFALLTPSARAQVVAPSPTLSTSGVSQIKTQPARQAALLVVLINVQARGLEPDRQAAINTLQTKVKAVRRALEQVGVSAPSIQDKAYTVFPYSEPPPGSRFALLPPGTASSGPAPEPKLPTPTAALPVQRFFLNQSLEVRTAAARSAAVMEAALRAGADGASVLSPFQSQGPAVSPDLPDATAFAKAVQQATQQAQVLAQASAQSAGVKLGGLRSIVVQTPSFSSGSAEGPFWRVQVNLVYSVVP